MTSKRLSLACSICHARKVRCSGSYPCANCTRRKEDCTFIEERKRGPQIKKRGSSQIVPAPTTFEILPRHPSTWTHLTFYCIHLESQPFIEYYFCKVHPSCPILDQSWTLSNFGELPLHLLHSMYSLCALSSSSRTYSVKLIMADLECADIYTVCSLVLYP